MQGEYKRHAAKGFKPFPTKKRIHRMIPRMVPRSAQSKWQLNTALLGVVLLSSVAMMSFTSGLTGVHHRRLPVDSLPKTPTTTPTKILLENMEACKTLCAFLNKVHFKVGDWVIAPKSGARKKSLGKRYFFKRVPGKVAGIEISNKGEFAYKIHWRKKGSFEQFEDRDAAPYEKRSKLTKIEVGVNLQTNWGSMFTSSCYTSESSVFELDQKYKLWEMWQNIKSFEKKNDKADLERKRVQDYKQALNAGLKIIKEMAADLEQKGLNDSVTRRKNALKENKYCLETRILFLQQNEAEDPKAYKKYIGELKAMAENYRESLNALGKETNFKKRFSDEYKERKSQIKQMITDIEDLIESRPQDAPSISVIGKPIKPIPVEILPKANVTDSPGTTMGMKDQKLHVQKSHVPPPKRDTKSEIHVKQSKITRRSTIGKKSKASVEPGRDAKSANVGNIRNPTSMPEILEEDAHRNDRHTVKARTTPAFNEELEAALKNRGSAPNVTKPKAKNNMPKPDDAVVVNNNNMAKPSIHRKRRKRSRKPVVTKDPEKVQELNLLNKDAGRRRLIGNHLSSEELLELCIEHGHVPRPN